MGINMTSKRRIGIGRRIFRHAALWGSAAIIPSLFQSCDNFLVGITRYADPCGTILDCPPGSFAVNAAAVGDYSVDCTCTVPGACNPGIPLNIITHYCQ